VRDVGLDRTTGGVIDLADPDPTRVYGRGHKTVGVVLGLGDVPLRVRGGDGAVVEVVADLGGVVGVGRGGVLDRVDSLDQITYGVVARRGGRGLAGAVGVDEGDIDADLLTDLVVDIAGHEVVGVAGRGHALGGGLLDQLAEIIV
jgi:hypothetical protein